MEKFIINGGIPLKGEVTISGAKNAVVAILPATVLAGDVCVIENLPNISDVDISIGILQDIGARVRRINKSTLEIDTTHVKLCEVPSEKSRQMRASYYYLGAMLGRFGAASVSMPGGCDLGARPIDQHLKAFEALGASINIEYAVIHADSEELVGEHIFFDTVSVGATINAMLASVHAKGTTVLENVAKEPHIVDVANFLNSMGADIRGAGTDVIKIRGVSSLHGSHYAAIPDQIEAGTYMAAAVATHGDVLVKNVIPKHMEPIVDKLEKAGATIEEFADSIRVSCTGDITPVNIKTMPHPGFPTDMQPIMGTLMSVAKGTAIVTESIWDNRFRYTEELLRMGANVQVDGRVAVFEGVEALQPAPLRAADLRAGAALVVAALMAKGESEIEHIEHIERGYEDIVQKLQALGADIRKINTGDAMVQVV